MSLDWRAGRVPPGVVGLARRSAAVWGFFLASALAVTGCGGAQRTDGAGAELKIRKVVLFQSGVGYFERRGEIRGDKVELRVRPDQINDVLKSLTILHLSNGQTGSVTMPVEQSADRLAAELPESVRNARGLVGMLHVLRGVEVTIKTDDEDLRGRVVGVEGANEGKKGQATVTLLVEDEKLVAVPIAKVQKVKIHDRALASGLARSLEISRAEGQWKPVGLTVHLAGDGSHDLLIGYIHEVPIWRPAYRAWVEKERGVQLQGWAIVDNVSGEDWKDVRLSLVVGSPLSFRYELHKPHHVQRPDLSSRLPQSAAAPPPPDVGYGPAQLMSDGSAQDDFEGGGGGAAGMMDAEGSAPAPMMKKAERASAGRPGRPMPRMAPPPAAAPEPEVDMDARRRAVQRSAQAMAEGRKMGQLYRYDALAPVTVGDGQAALVNIVNRQVEGADIFLFRNGNGGEMPYRSLMLRNPKGSALESGPITLYVDGTFAGEGFLGRVDEEATAFIPFAAADGFALTPHVETRNADMTLVKASGGRLTIESKLRQVRTVTLRSERDERSLCYVKIVLNSSMTLENPPKDLVRAGTDVYLRIDVPGKRDGKPGEATVTLVESTKQSRIVTGLDSWAIEAFQLLVKNADIDEAVKGPVRELLAAQEKLGELQRRRNELAHRQHELAMDAERIRQNLQSLPLEKVADKLRKTLVDQLEQNSQRAAEAQKQMVELDVEMAALREKINQIFKQIELK